MSLEQKRQRVMQLQAQLVQTQAVQLQDKSIFIEALQEQIRLQGYRFELLERQCEHMERQCEISDRQCEISDRQCELLKRENLLLKKVLDRTLATRDMATGILPNERSGTGDGKILGSDKIKSPDGATLPCDQKNNTKADCAQLGESMTQDSRGSNEQGKN